MCVIPGSQSDEQTHRHIEELTQSLLDGESPQLLLERGHAHKQVGHLNAAVEDLTRVIAHPAADTGQRGRAHYFLGVCHRRTGNLEAALASADMAVELDPGNASVIGHRGYVRSMLGWHELALADYAEALRLAPHLGVTYAFRGNGWFWQGNYEFALADYGTLIDNHHDDLLFKVFHDRAAARLMVHDIAGAIADLDRAEELRPSDPWYPLDSRPLALRAFAHLVDGDLEKCAGDLHGSQHLGTNPIGSITEALLGARLGHQESLRKLTDVAVCKHVDGPIGGLQMVADLIDNPTSYLPQLSPLIG